MGKKTIKGGDFENGHLTVREGHGSVRNVLHGISVNSNLTAYKEECLFANIKQYFQLSVTTLRNDNLLNFRQAK